MSNVDAVAAVETPVVEATADPSSSAPSHQVFNEGIIIIFLMIMIYMGFEAFKHKHHISFGHEASLVTLVGFIVSYAFLSRSSTEFHDLMAFNDDLFFYFCLPPIVFASGFNMQRKKFFANFTNILLFGVVGTFIAFAVYSGLTILFMDNYREDGTLLQIDGKTGETSQLSMSTMEVLMMCSLLCSSDVIAAVSLINPSEQPKLFSLVFGEGIINDAVSIILFNTVMQFTKKSTEFTPHSVVVIAKDFLYLGFMSLLCGLFFALFCSYVLKRVRSLTKTPVSECAMIFCFGYVAYICAELWHLSGIISLLTSGIAMAQYAWFNLSPQGKQSSVVIFQFLGFLAEGFVFSYLGLTFFAYRNNVWSYELIILEMVIILIGRGMGTFGLIGLLKCCKYDKNQAHPISWKELAFIYYAGLIRGAIAFGLVLRIDPTMKNRSVIVTTCLSLVVFTTIFFGSTVGLLGKCLFKDSKQEDDDEKEEENEADSSFASESLSNSDKSSHREKLIHYNEQEESDHGTSHHLPHAMKLRRKKKGCVEYMRTFDNTIMRPIFIYHYEKDMEQKATDFYELFKEDGEFMESVYAKANIAQAEQDKKDGASSHGKKTGSDKSGKQMDTLMRSITISKKHHQNDAAKPYKTVSLLGADARKSMIPEPKNVIIDEQEEQNEEDHEFSSNQSKSNK